MKFLLFLFPSIIQAYYSTILPIPSADTTHLPKRSVPLNFFGLTTHGENQNTSIVLHGTVRTWDAAGAWATLQPNGPGTVDFTALDNFVYTLSQGKDVVWTFGRTPTWASLNPTDGGCFYEIGSCWPPSNMSYWDDFVTQMVVHYGDSIYYELWNEPNIWGTWTTVLSNYSALFEMSTRAYAIIKQHSPTAQVLCPSFTGGGWQDGYDKFFTYGTTGVCDIIAFHGYISNAYAEDIIAGVADYRSVLTPLGLGSLPMWDTEASWDDNGADYSTDQRFQAAFLMKYYVLHWSLGVERLIWYAFDGGPWGSLWNSTYGLNEAAYSYYNAVEWLVGSTMITACQNDTALTYTCLISKGTNYRGIIAWNSYINTTLTVDSYFYDYLDLLGNSHSFSNSQVHIGNEPILIEGFIPSATTGTSTTSTSSSTTSFSTSNSKSTSIGASTSTGTHKSTSGTTTSRTSNSTLTTKGANISRGDKLNVALLLFVIAILAAMM